MGGFVPGATARYQRDLPGLAQRGGRLVQHHRLALQQRQAGRHPDDPFEHFRNDIVGVIDELFHFDPRSAHDATVCCKTIHRIFVGRR